MRPLPIPVSAPLHSHATPWWLGRSHAPSFSDVFRAFFPAEETPRSFQPGSAASWMDFRILVIQWVQITYVRTVQTGIFHPSGMPPKAAPPPPPRDPLIIDLDGQGPQTSGAEGAQNFDLAGNGQQRLTSFVKGNSAFLALDLNGNGRIDSGAELFGDQHGAGDGYEELRKYDLGLNQFNPSPTSATLGPVPP